LDRSEEWSQGQQSFVSFAHGAKFAEAQEKAQSSFRNSQIGAGNALKSAQNPASFNEKLRSTQNESLRSKINKKKE